MAVFVSSLLPRSFFVDSFFAVSVKGDVYVSSAVYGMLEFRRDSLDGEQVHREPAICTGQEKRSWKCVRIVDRIQICRLGVQTVRQIFGRRICKFPALREIH